jgi:hypothetical protein
LFAGETGLTGDLRHTLGARHHPQRMRDVARVVTLKCSAMKVAIASSDPRSSAGS